MDLPLELKSDPVQDMSSDKKAAKKAGGNKAAARASKDTSEGDDDSDEAELGGFSSSSLINLELVPCSDSVQHGLPSIANIFGLCSGD